MRLGKQKSILQDGQIKDLYEQSNRINKNSVIEERFRHRYEVHPDFVTKLSGTDFLVSGVSKKEGIVQFMEMKEDVHPYYVGTQSHPELTSRLEDPAPLFVGLIKACLK